MCFQNHSHNANSVTDQDNAQRTGECVLCSRCSRTVAKHQGPYARNQNDRHWSPQTTGHAHLHNIDRICESMCSQMKQTGYSTGILQIDTKRIPVMTTMGGSLKVSTSINLYRYEYLLQWSFGHSLAVHCFVWFLYSL